MFLQSHASTFTNSKQYTKQFHGTLDTVGQPAFLCEFLHLPLTWRTEDSGIDFSSKWGYLLHSIVVFQQQLQLGMNLAITCLCSKSRNALVL